MTLRRLPALVSLSMAGSVRHVYIKPRSPRLNGKVERSHRFDQEECYQLMTYRWMKAIMPRIRDTADQAQVPFVFLLIPHPIDIAENYEWAHVETKRFRNYDRRNLVAPLDKNVRAAGVHFVNLFDIYRQQDSNRLYFHGGNDHWNSMGQKLAAVLVSNYLLNNELFERGHK